jgi:hypothetical protein
MFAQDLHHNQIVTFDFNASFTGTLMEFYRFKKRQSDMRRTRRASAWRSGSACAARAIPQL